MYRLSLTKPKNTSIQLIECRNRGGHIYRHAFIGNYAISKRMERILLQEFGISCCNDQMIPDSFFDRYDLIEVCPDYENQDREHFVTSDYWYSCRPKVTFTGIEL